MVSALVAIGVVVGIALVFTGSRDKSPSAASATTLPSAGSAESAATTIPAGPSSTGGSSDTAFAAVPGYTFEEAPASVISEVRRGFEAGMRSSLKMPGVSVDPDASSKVLSGVSGRLVSRDGQEVALAVAMKFDGLWVARIDASEFLAGAASKLAAPEHVTVGGIDAVYADSDGSTQLLTYKDGTFLLVIADSGDRATLDQVMAGLIANLG